MIAEKKLSWFKKLMIGLGKRLFFYKSNKFNVLGLGLALRECLRIYEELEGNLEGALTEIEMEIEDQAVRVITDMLCEPILLGVSLSYALPRDISDLAFFTQAMFHGMIGKECKNLFEYPELIINVDKSGKLIIRMKQCIMCDIISDVTAKDLGEKEYGNMVAKLFGTIIQEAWRFAELPYKVIKAEETKCFLKGDSCGEFTISFSLNG